MYNSSYFPSSVRPNPYTTSYSLASQTYDYHNNQYYAQKIFDDHRLQRKMLQRPAFLIKQEALYPQYDTFRIGSTLDYADSLTRPKSNRFYSHDAEEQRIRVQGVNPFYQTNPYVETSVQNSYLKRGSKSRMDTNPNLGVTSYQILNQPSLMTSKRRKQPQKIEKTSIKKQNQAIEDYITNSILQNSARSANVKPRPPVEQNAIIRQEENSDEDLFYSKRNTFNPAKVIRKTKSTMVKSKENPEQLIYKGRKYVKLAV